MGLLLAGLGGMASQGIDIINKRQEEEQAQEKEARAAATQKSMAEYQNELAMKREAATLELQKKYRRDEETYQASPERVTQLAGADALKTDLGKSTRDKLFAEQLENYKSKSAAELEAEVKKLTDPNYLQGKRAEARATNIDNGAGLRAVQLEAATYALKQEKGKQSAIDSYVAEQDPTKKQSMFKDLVARGILKDKDEGFIERSVKTIDEKGNEITEKSKVRPGLIASDKAATPAVTQAAIDKLLANPDKASDFDAKFGQGKAAAILSQTKKVTDNIQVASGPKEGDTRQVSVGRGQGNKTQVYARTGRGGSSYGWVDQ